MTKRTYLNIVLLALIIPINELHRFWQDDLRTVNPWLHRDYPLNIQWFFKFLFRDISDIIKALLLYRAARMHQVALIATSVYLFITCLDFFLFIYTNNQMDGTLYYSLVSLMIIVAAYRYTVKPLSHKLFTPFRLKLIGRIKWLSYVAGILSVLFFAYSVNGINSPFMKETCLLLVFSFFISCLFICYKDDFEMHIPHH